MNKLMIRNEGSKFQITIHSCIEFFEYDRHFHFKKSRTQRLAVQSDDSFWGVFIQWQIPSIQAR